MTQRHQTFIRRVHRGAVRIFATGTVLSGLALAMLGPNSAQAADNWVMDPEQSKLDFIFTQMGSPIRGTFQEFSTEILFSADDLTGSAVRVEIPVNSNFSGDTRRDDVMLQPELLHAAEHPTAIYEAQGFTVTGDNSYSADGTLTLRGETNPLPITFTLNVDGDTAVAEGQTTLDRTDFGVSQGDWSGEGTVLHEVRVEFTITANRG